MARFMAGLDTALAGPHAEFASQLLASIVPEQRWGIPAALGDRWRIQFKRLALHRVGPAHPPGGRVGPRRSSPGACRADRWPADDGIRNRHRRWDRVAAAGAGLAGVPPGPDQPKDSRARARRGEPTIAPDRASYREEGRSLRPRRQPSHSAAAIPPPQVKRSAALRLRAASSAFARTCETGRPRPHALPSASSRSECPGR